MNSEKHLLGYLINEQGGGKEKKKNEKIKPKAGCKKTNFFLKKAQHIFHLTMTSLVYLNGNKTYCKASEIPLTKTAKCTITPL